MNTRSSPVRFLGWLCASLAIALSGPHAVAQSDRRGREDPELVLESGGRQGACDQLLFTPDGKYLLAAGDDKVVRVWHHADGVLNPKGLKPLRWSIWRERRGSIYALAVSPDGCYVAVGGYGPWSSTVAVIDRVTGAMVRSTVAGGGKVDVKAVWALGFDPTGERIAIGTELGEIWVWDYRVDKQPRRVSPRPAEAKTNLPRLVHFLDHNTLLSVVEKGPVLRWDLTRQPAEATEMPSVQDEEKHPVFRAEVSRDGRWLAAAASGPAVTVRSLDGTRQSDIHLKEGEFPRSLAFDPRRDRLAVAVGHVLPNAPGFYMEADDTIRLYDLTQSPPHGVPGPRHSWRADRLTFDPTGKYLAVAGGDYHEVTVWDLANLKEAASVRRGVGTALWDVGLSEDGQLGFRDQRNRTSVDPNCRGTGDWSIFDLKDRVWADGKQFKRVRGLREAGGWHIEPSRKSPFVWYAVDSAGNPFELPLTESDQMPRCWTFLPEREGRPTLLAVGHYWGVSIFALTAGARPKRTRLCVGHQGDVVALGLSADGDWLVSAGRDLTIAAWDLRGVDRPDIGGRFVLRGDPAGLFVEEVTPGGPAWEAGLVPGDEVVLFAVGPREVPGGPAAWEARLRHPEPGRQHAFEVLRGGKRTPRIPLGTSCYQRPLWRFFPTRDREWLLWMWRNSYYDTSPKGDTFAGWHVNGPGLVKTPTYYPLEQFRKQLERPDVIDKLLETRSPAEALALTDTSKPVQFDQSEPPAARIAVVKKQPGKDVTVKLVATAHGDNPDHQPQRAELWLNDFRFKVWDNLLKWDKTDLTYALALEVPGEWLRNGDNVLTFQTFTELGWRSDGSVPLTWERPKKAPRLWGLFVGIDNYRGPVVGPGRRGKPAEPLKCARRDAEAMHKAWSAQPFYAQADVRVVDENKAEQPGDLTAALDELAQKAGPDDRFVLFLAGHGVFVPQKGGGQDTFVFCCRSYNSKEPTKTGLSSNVLYDKLARIRCRKLVLFDACHTGLVASPSRQLTPGGQGPIVLAACDRSQSSYESKDRYGHGLFTAAVLEALGDKFDDADEDGNKNLSVAELVGYTRRRLPELLKGIGLEPDMQQPQWWAPPGADRLEVAARTDRVRPAPGPTPRSQR